MSLQSTDQIADFITRIRNAVMVGKTEVLVPTSKLKLAVAEVLVKNGYGGTGVIAVLLNNQRLHPDT